MFTENISERHCAATVFTTQFLQCELLAITIYKLLAILANIYFSHLCSYRGIVDDM